MKNLKYDENITIPEELSECVERGVNDAKRPNYYCRNKSRIIVSLILVCVISLGFNPNARAYTANLPIVKDVMKWFKSDENINKVKENKFKVYDLVTEKDGYKLYMKDIYFDEERFSMKIAVEDENGAAFNIKEWNMTSNHIGEDYIRFNGESIKNVDPWYDVWNFSYLGSLFDKNNYNYGKVDIKLKMTVSDGNKTIHFNEVEINEENVIEAKPKVFIINKEYVFDGAKILIEHLKIYPNRMEVKVSSRNSDIDSKVTYMKMKLTDKNGKVYEKSSASLYRRICREFVFNDSIYFDNDNSIEKIGIELGVGKVQTMKIIEKANLTPGDNDEFSYNNVKFKAYVDENDTDYTYLDVKINDSQDLYSSYYIRKWTGAWEEMSYCDPNESTSIRITKNEIEKELGKDLEEILKLDDDEFYNYAVKYNKYIDSRKERNEKTINNKINIDLTKESMKMYIEERALTLGEGLSIGDVLKFGCQNNSTSKNLEFGIIDGSKIKTEHIELELD